MFATKHKVTTAAKIPATLPEEYLHERLALERYKHRQRRFHLHLCKQPERPEHGRLFCRPESNTPIL